MKGLDEKLIGTGKSYLCGDAITIADYYAAAFVALAEAIRSDLSTYPNVKRWLANMKKLKSWAKVNEAIDGFAASMKDVAFETV